MYRWIIWKLVVMATAGFCIRCRALEVLTDNFLLVADQQLGVYQMELTSGQARLVANTSGAIGVDYDVSSQKVYWTNLEEKTIYSADLSGANMMSVHTFGNGSELQGLAVHSQQSSLFYVDKGLMQIGRMKLDGSQHMILVATDIERPRGIVLDTQNNLIYWTDWRLDSRIERAQLDGSNRQVVVDTGRGNWPNGLSLDLTGGHIYWCDASTHTIWRSKLDGSGPQQLFKGPDIRFYDVTFFMNRVFYTAWESRTVQVLVPGAQDEDVWNTYSLGPAQFRILQAITVYHSGSGPAACWPGFFGPGCLSRCHCASGAPCQELTGTCPGACLPGYTGVSCNTPCPPGYYGNQCLDVCRCVNLKECSHVNGACADGVCPSGSMGKSCHTTCDLGHFGISCLLECHCEDSGPCTPDTGHCLSGRCEPGWQGDNCSINMCVDSATLRLAASQGLSSGCEELALLSSLSLEECQLAACRQGGDTINFRPDYCSVRRCEGDMKATPGQGAWDIYSVKPDITDKDAGFPAHVWPLVGGAGGLLVLLVSIFLIVYLCKKRKQVEPPSGQHVNTAQVILPQQQQQQQRQQQQQQQRQPHPQPPDTDRPESTIYDEPYGHMNTGQYLHFAPGGAPSVQYAQSPPTYESLTHGNKERKDPDYLSFEGR